MRWLSISAAQMQGCADGEFKLVIHHRSISVDASNRRPLVKSSNLNTAPLYRYNGYPVYAKSN